MILTGDKKYNEYSYCDTVFDDFVIKLLHRITSLFIDVFALPFKNTN